MLLSLMMSYQALFQARPPSGGGCREQCVFPVSFSFTIGNHGVCFVSFGLVFPLLPCPPSPPPAIAAKLRLFDLPLPWFCLYIEVFVSFGSSSQALSQPLLRPPVIAVKTPGGAFRGLLLAFVHGGEESRRTLIVLLLPLSFFVRSSPLEPTTVGEMLGHGKDCSSCSVHLYVCLCHSCLLLFLTLLSSPLHFPLLLSPPPFF